jgi:hypothetical protein
LINPLRFDAAPWLPGIFFYENLSQTIRSTPVGIEAQAGIGMGYTPFTAGSRCRAD